VEIILGSANFAQGYGLLANNLPISDIEQLLSLAHDEGIKLVDTSPSYGDSEKILGDLADGRFEYITKFSNLDAENLELEEKIDGSLVRLRTTYLHAMLFHRSSDLLGSNGKKLLRKALELKKLGKIANVGVSIYDPSELDSLPEIGFFDIVQGPLNVFDQRIITTGWASKMESLGIQFHARSIFLQGMLLLAPRDIPNKLRKFESSWLAYRDWMSSKGLQGAQGPCSFIKDKTQVSAAVVGVNSTEQLTEIVSAFEEAEKYDAAELGTNDLNLIDPRNWP
jgi:aryl-alcohol dehydrogenase-like predicted oxidoreductase